MEERILKTFLYKNKLKFSDIEKTLHTRSNKLSYHLKNLVQKNMIQKQDEYYTLTNHHEPNIPYLHDKKSPLPVVLVAITNNEGNTFLIKRNKRPFQNKLGLPGGRLLASESIEKGTKRIAQKWNVNATLEKIHSVSLEHVTKDDTKIHSFLLILVKATTNNTIPYTNVEDNKEQIIESDYNLLQNDTTKEIILNEVFTPN